MQAKKNFLGYFCEFVISAENCADGFKYAPLINPDTGVPHSGQALNGQAFQWTRTLKPARLDTVGT